MSVRALRDSGDLEESSTVWPGMSGSRWFLRFEVGYLSPAATTLHFPATGKRFISHDPRYDDAHRTHQNPSEGVCHVGGF